MALRANSWNLLPQLLSAPCKNRTHSTSFCSDDSRVRKKGSFGKGVLFRKAHFLEILENLEILEFLEIPQTLEGASDHVPEILENLDILETLEIAPVKRPLS